MSASVVDAVSNVTQCGKVISVTFTFRDSYEAAVCFDEIADDLTKHGNVSLKIEGRFRRLVPETKQEEPASRWRAWAGPAALCAFLALYQLFH